MTRSEACAYAAALIDGEGCIGAYPAHECSYSYRVVVTVTMTKVGACKFLSDNFGRPVHLLNRVCKGSGKPLFRWSLYARQAADFLEEILPYLQIKRDQAADAITLSRLHRRKGGIPKRTVGGWINPRPADDNIAERHALGLRMRERNR